MINSQILKGMSEETMCQAVVGAWRELVRSLFDASKKELKVDLTTEQMLAFLFVSIYMDNMGKRGNLQSFKNNILASMGDEVINQ